MFLDKHFQRANKEQQTKGFWHRIVVQCAHVLLFRMQNFLLFLLCLFFLSPFLFILLTTKFYWNRKNYWKINFNSIDFSNGKWAHLNVFWRLNNFELFIFDSNRENIVLFSLKLCSAINSCRGESLSTDFFLLLQWLEAISKTSNMKLLTSLFIKRWKINAEHYPPIKASLPYYFLRYFYLNLILNWIIWNNI